MNKNALHNIFMSSTDGAETVDPEQQATNLLVKIIKFYRTAIFTDSYRVTIYVWKYVKGSTESKNQNI